MGGVKFYAVKTRLFCPPGSLGKPAGDFVNLLDRHFQRKLILLLGMIDAAGTNGRLAGDLGHCSGAGMAELCENLDAFLMDTVRQPCKRGDHIIGSKRRLAGMCFPLKMNIAVFRNDQSDFTVFSPFPVVITYRVGHAAVLIHFCGGHGRHHKAVVQGQVLNGDRIEYVCHKGSSISEIK